MKPPTHLSMVRRHANFVSLFDAVYVRLSVKQDFQRFCSTDL
jgi:hypothetical protein